VNRLLLHTAFIVLMLFASHRALSEDRIPVGQTNSVEFNTLYQAILDDAGINYNMLVIPTNRKRRMFVAGEILIDCCTAKVWRTRPEEIASQLNSREFIKSAEHYVFHKNNDIEIHSVDQLKRHRIAIVRGFVYKQQDYFGEVLETTDLDEMLRVVAAGRAEVGIINPYDFRRRMKTSPLPLRLGSEHEASSLVIRVHKSRPELLQRINAVIDQYLAEGRILKQIGPLSAGQERLIQAGQGGSAGFRSVWQAILEDTGLNVQIINAPQARKRMLFSSGIFALDCCSVPAWRTLPEEEDVQLYSDVIYETHERYITLRGAGIDITDPIQLKGYRVAAVRGYNYPFEHLFGVTVLGNSIEDVLELVSAGRAQVAIVSETDFLMSMAKTARPLEMGEVNAVAALRARVHKDYADLLPMLNRSIAKLKETGRIEALVKRAVTADEAS